MSKLSKEEVEELAERLKSTGIRKIITGHCTGEEAYAVLKKDLGARIEQLYTGMELEI